MKPNFRPLSKTTVWLLTAPMRRYFSPKIFGLENIGQGPYLFVGNHTIYGVLDVPLYAAVLYRRKNIYLRGLGDHYHFMIPGWGGFLEALGAVHGTPENCAALMEQRENIIVFPGGGREVCKRKGEAYKLIWKQRTGFARLAIQHGYPIVPVASVGPENAYSILFDADDFMASWMGKVLDKNGVVEGLLRNGEAVPPIARGILLTPIPRPERFYVMFGKPIDTSPYQGRQDEKKVQQEVRTLTEKAINAQFGKLLLYREQDTKKGVLRRILTHL
ncbi:MAG: lysophospholipid acyltransferase family protein [Thermodesulfobacteriota bacterium]